MDDREARWMIQYIYIQYIYIHVLAHAKGFTPCPAACGVLARIRVDGREGEGGRRGGWDERGRRARFICAGRGGERRRRDEWHRWMVCLGPHDRGRKRVKASLCRRACCVYRPSILQFTVKSNYNSTTNAPSRGTHPTWDEGAARTLGASAH